MKPIDFKERNIIVAEEQPEYVSLPALKLDSGEIVSCWKLNLIERLRVLINGKIWHSALSFNKPVTPIYIDTRRKSIYYTNNDDKIKTKIIKWLCLRDGKGKRICLPIYIRLWKYEFAIYSINRDWASLRAVVGKENKIILVIKKGIA